MGIKYFALIISELSVTIFVFYFSTGEVAFNKPYPRRISVTVKTVQRVGIILPQL